MVQANEKMPWVFQIHSKSISESSSTSNNSLTLRYSIYRVDLGHKVLSGQRELTVDRTAQTQTFSVDDRAPKVEGVYEVRFQFVRRSDKLWARLRPKDTVLEAIRVPMLVRSPPSTASPDPAGQSASWQTIGEIRPSQKAIGLDTATTLGQWLPDSAVRLIPGVRYVKGILNSGQAHGESISIIQPKNVFQAKLPIMAIGYPHRITIRCPRDQAKGLRIDFGHGADQTQSRFSSTVQSSDDLNHDLAFRQREMTSTSDPKSSSSDTRWLVQTYLYYPQHDDQIWISNLNESGTVAFESVTVTAGPSTTANLNRRQNTEGPKKREIVLAISDPDWMQTWTEDWQPADESSVCQPRSIGLHRSWLAAHRLVEQAQLMAASSVSIPLEHFDPVLTGPTPDDHVADIEATALHIFNRFQLNIKPSVSLEKKQANSLERSIHRLSEFHCVDGFVISVGQQSQIAEDVLAVLQRASRSKHLFVRADASLEASTKQAIADIEDAILVSKFDGLGSIRPAAKFVSAGTSQNRCVAMDDHPIARQEPANCLFEIIRRSNPNVILIDESVVRGTINQNLNRIIRSYEAFPIASISQIAPLNAEDGTCQIVQAISEDQILISFSNLAPWDSIIGLESGGNADSLLSEPLLWERIDDESFASINGLKLSQGLIVPARETVLLRSRFPVPMSARDSISSWRWKSQVVGGEPIVNQIKKDVTGIVERVGMLSDPVSNDHLNNGSFETVGEMGLVGWLHAQHPPGCVVVDSKESSDGVKSIRLATDQAVSARTWLVSDTIEVPTSGRLAVSMALRGSHHPEKPVANTASSKNQPTASDQASNLAKTKQRITPPSDNVQRLRVSLEGTQAGVPIRKSAEVEIPCTETWQPRSIVLEVDSLDPSTTESLRLTIDSMTPGLVWIDDVRLHDDFSTARERTDLQTQAFLAVEGLHRGNLTPSANLLMNRWASRLLEQSNQEEETTEKPSDSTEPAKSPLNEDVQEIANKNRAWLLDRLRF
jgi:hypothetical protein